MPVNRLYSHARALWIRQDLRKAGLGGPRANIPIIYVPGILGTKLYDRLTQTNIWGAPAALLRPKACHASYSLGSADLSPATDHTVSRVIANEQLHSFNIIPGLVETLVTADLLHVFEHALGYKEGRDLFFIGHDWRQDYRKLGRLLTTEMERISCIFGNRQPVILMGQSMANLAIQHWLGGLPLAEQTRVARWYLFGPPWWGTYHALSMLHKGYYPASRKFRGFSPLDACSFASAYQLLPQKPLVLAADGTPIQGRSFFEAECWREFALGPWSKQLRGLFSTDGDRYRFLEPYLANAGSFVEEMHKARAQTAAIPQVWFLGDANMAVRAAVWSKGQMLVSGKDILSATPHLASKALAPGDDHLPLEDFAHNANGPFVRDCTNVPFGSSYMFVSKAKDHRALINHTSNLKVIAHDIAMLRQGYTIE